MATDLQQAVEELRPQLQTWRRDFHKYAESGFLEMRTASIVAAYLEKLGYKVKAGSEVMKAEERMGVPDEEVLIKHEKWAKENGADEKWLQKLTGGMTGVVGILETGKPGPVIAFRVDMDALDIQEELSEDHIPFAEGFASVNANMMHACGHDGHTAMGLGLASLLIQQKDRFKGTFKLIFQPAEEGTRGAKSMTEAGIVDDVDYFVATHLGTGVPAGEIVAGNAGFLATTKMDVVFKGKASHAGGRPHEGKNALMAASTAVLGLYGIPRHADGASRVNVGVLQAGSGRNIIPSQALLKIETRGETSEINDYIREQALNVLNGAATMYDTEVAVNIVGEARSSMPSPELVEIVAKAAGQSPFVEKVTKLSTDAAGSEDATYFMERVKEKGGLATYIIVGTPLAAGHHNERFDYDEEVLPTGVDVLARIAASLATQ
ncbi:aminobenzoyl-glutamate utilization protein A [Planomicrobium soli]|uniref:Aminobenzoyl-glutamate utilization protein A n=1 Tax=Planomicrobium soli TaxID=1176648 RepID=A0A2P8H2C3_9BACL|nr:M20 family metallo-hydrolase [Planomicrobium soli]PSL40358.1 aminobenzoyl-glutamate utilization protein A [Planomicrobium soli]